MKWIRFSRNEKKGMLILSLLLLANLTYHLYKYIQLDSRISPYPIALFWPGDKIKKQATEPKFPSQNRSKREEKRQFTLFEFNPNSIHADSIDLLGISKFAKTNLLKYRENGGRFKKKSDLKKIFGLTEELYENLYPYIDLPIHTEKSQKYIIDEKAKSEKRYDYPKKVDKQIFVDVNQASVEDLKRLRGIGPVLADRIVKYRALLGGYTGVEQVKEVYGLSDSTFQFISSHLTLENTSIDKILINEVSFKELLKHPYADYEFTRILINYRKQHSYFRTKEDLENIYNLDQTKMIKLIPYLDFAIPSENNEKDESNNKREQKPAVSDTSLQSQQFHPQFQQIQGLSD